MGLAHSIGSYGIGSLFGSYGIGSLYRQLFITVIGIYTMLMIVLGNSEI